MKKLLSLILAISMVLSLVCGASFASAEGEVDAEAEARTYCFDLTNIAKLNSTKVEDMQKSDVKLNCDGELWWDTTDTRTGTASYFRASNMKAFANHGWKWLDINDEALENGEIVSTAIQLSNAQLRLTAKRNSAVYAAKGMQVGLVLQKPETTGFYKTTINAAQETTATLFDFYLSSELTESDLTETDEVKNYVKDEMKAASQTITGTANDYEVNNLIYSNASSSGDLIFVASQSAPGDATGYGMLLYSVTLAPAEVQDVALSFDNATLTSRGEKTQATVTATLSDNSTMGVVDSFVTYESSDTSVVTVEKNTGEVTAVGFGTATITASVGDKTAEETITVDGTKVYTFNRSLVYGVDGVWVEKEGVSTPAWAAISVADYGTHGWKFFAIDDTSLSYVMGTNNCEVHSMRPMNLNSELRVSTQHDEYKGNNLENGVQIAVALETADTDFYVASVNAWNPAGGGDKKFGFYLSNEASSKDVDDYIESADFAYTAARGEVDTEDAGVVIYADKTKNLIAGFDIPAETPQMYIAGVTLTPINVQEISLSASKSVLDIGETSALNVKAADHDVVDSFVTYTVAETSDVIDVATDGTITAKGAGSATVTAEVGGKTGSTEISVNAPAEDEDFTKEFTGENGYTTDSTPAFTAPAEGEVAKTIVNLYSAVVGGTGETAILENESVPLGTKYSYTAPTKEGYTFRYWAKALSDKKQIVTRNATVEFMPTTTRTNLVAVYEPENATATVTGESFYNANGQLLTDVSIDNNKMPPLPSMAGYGAASVWVQYGTGAEFEAEAEAPTENLMFVAKYAEPATTYAITVVDGTQSGDGSYTYGDEVTCTATVPDDKLFKCWTKTVGETTRIISLDEEYTFNVWEACTLTAVFADEAPVFSGNTFSIILSSMGTVDDDTAYMAEFVGLGDAVEKGIVFGTKRVAMTTDAAQFTVVNDTTETDVKGYAILSDGTVIYDK